MKSVLLAVVVACLSVAPCFGQEDVGEARPDLPAFSVFGEAASNEDGEAIAARMREFAGAWGSGDAEAVAAFYADDAEWTNAFGDVIRGSDELQAFLTRLFAEDGEAISAEEEENMQPVSLRYVGDDVAVLHGLTMSTRGDARSGAGERRVHTTFVLAKEDGAWRIVHQMIMDARE